MLLRWMLCSSERSMRILYQTVVVNNYQRVQSPTFVRMRSSKMRETKIVKRINNNGALTGRSPPFQSGERCALRRSMRPVMGGTG